MCDCEKIWDTFAGCSRAFQKRTRLRFQFPGSLTPCSMDCDPASLRWAGHATSPRAHPFAQGLPRGRVELTPLPVPSCCAHAAGLCPSAGQQICVSPQSLQCRGWPGGATGRLRATAEHLQPIPRTGATASVAWPCRPPREQLPPAAPHVASLGTEHSPQLCALLSPRFPLLRPTLLVKRDCPGGATSRELVPRSTRPCWHTQGLQQCLLWESCGSSCSSPRPPRAAALPFQSMARCAAVAGTTGPVENGALSSCVLF